MAPYIDQDAGPADADTLAAMAGSLRDRVIAAHIEREDACTLPLFDGPDIFGEIDSGA